MSVEPQDGESPPLTEMPPVDPPPPIAPPVDPPLAQVQAQISDGLVIASGYFPAGSPDPATVAIVDIYDPVEAAKLSQPGAKHINLTTGVITVTPPPPLPLQYTGTIHIDVQARTTDDVVKEITRITMGDNVVHQADMKIIGIDAVSFVSRAMVGHFVHRRRLAGAIQVGIVVVSDIPNPPTAPSNAWAANALPSGNDVVFTVKGAVGRTIDWTLTGDIFVYAPAGK